MPRPLKWGILGASTIILSKDIDKYAFMFGSNFYESDVNKIKLTMQLDTSSQDRPKFWSTLHTLNDSFSMA